MLEKLLRGVIITSVLDEDPPRLVVGGGGGYTRHHLSDEPHGQNLLALKFEYPVCTKLALLVKQPKEV